MKRQYGTFKFLFTAALIGVFSPSVSTVDQVYVSEVSGSVKRSVTTLELTWFNEAKAAPIHRQTRRVSRRTSRRTSYRHNAGHYYGGGHYHGHHHHHHHGHYHGHPILTFTAGLAIGSIVAASTMPRSCVTTVVGGTSYRRCGNDYYLPVYQGDTVAYKVVAPPR